MPEFILGIVASMLAGLAISYAFFHFADDIERTFARIGPRSKISAPSINGIYYSIYWRLNRENELRKYASLYSIRRKRGYSAEQFIFTNLFGGENQCVLKGSIDKLGFISGEWRSGSREYHGAFQFMKLRGHNVIMGKWLGFNANNRINCGVWAFYRLTPEYNPIAEQSMKDRFRPDEAGVIFDQKCETEIMKVLHEESEKDMSLCIRDVDVSDQQLRRLDSDRLVAGT